MDIGNDLLGIAAIITAIGTSWLGYITVRTRRKADNAQGSADNAQGTADAAHDTSKLNTSRLDKIDAKAEYTGVMDLLRGEVGALQTQLVQMSQTTGEQIAASTAALVACEERHRKKDEYTIELADQVHELRKDVRILQATLHGMHPELLAPPAD